MIGLTFLNSNSAVTMSVLRANTSMVTNTIFLYFGNDEEARTNEDILKRNGYKTNHYDSMIAVRDLNSFDLMFGE